MTIPVWFAAEFDTALALMFASDDPEGPHRTRVVLRRFRAVVTGYSDILSQRVQDKLHRRCRTYFRLIGHIRDADVLRLHITRKSDIKAATKDASTLRQAIRRSLTDKGARKFSTEIARLLGDKDCWRKSAKARALRRSGFDVLAARALQAAFAKARRYPADLAVLDEDILHDFRKDMKTLRYLADHFAVVRPGPLQCLFIDQLRRLQDALGGVNDAYLAKAAGLGTLVQKDVLLAEARNLWTAIAASDQWWQRADDRP